MKKGLLAVLLSVVLFAPEAFAGPRTGGSFGGRSKAPARSTGSSTVYSGGGYGGGGFFFLPSFGGGYGGGGSIFGVLLLLGVLYFVVLRPALAARRNSQGDDSYNDAPRSKPGVYTLDVAVSSTAARDLQKRLEEIGATGGGEDMLAKALRETALNLLRRKEEIEGANLTVREKISVQEAERLFEASASQARSRYQVDVYSAQDGKVRRSEAPADTGKEGILEFMVVSFVVGTLQPLAMPAKITDRKTMEEALLAFSSLPASQLAALEVIWTPGDAKDSLTRDDLMTSFPEIVSL